MPFSSCHRATSSKYSRNVPADSKHAGVAWILRSPRFAPEASDAKRLRRLRKIPTASSKTARDFARRPEKFAVYFRPLRFHFINLRPCLRTPEAIS